MASTSTSTSLHYSFSGRRVLVTGGASGIGRGIAQAFYADGAHVFVLDRNAETLAALKIELPNVTTICVDLLDWSATKKAVEALGPLDHLVNNAGILDMVPLQALSEEVFDRHLGVNLKAVLNVSQAFVKGIAESEHKKAEGGTIVNISSVADVMTWRACGHYSAAKAGVSMLTKSMALEFADVSNRIRVNAIRPGTVLGTALFDSLGPEALAKAVAANKARAVIQHRDLQPADIANGVLFLSSPLAEMITGATIPIDQGLSIT